MGESVINGVDTIPELGDPSVPAANGDSSGQRTVLSITRDSVGLLKALEHLGVQARFNLRAQRHEWRNVEDAIWLATNERIEANLREHIERSCSIDGKPARFGRDSWPLALNALLFESEVDPLLEWLEALRPWDGTPRIDRLVRNVFEVDEEYEPVAVWAARHILIGAVWRAYAPGMKMDEIPVLTSAEQGIGKSSLLACLLPVEYRDDWFADGLHLAAPAKERAEALLGRVIVEVSEMAGATRAGQESLKAFLSRTNDGVYRMAYRRDPEPLPRRCVIVGTTNDDSHLPNDPSGNRRFVSVVVKPRSWGTEGVMEYVDEQRDQLWAEAYYRQQGGEEARLPDELKPLQRDLNERHRRNDHILEDKVDGFLEKRQDGPFKLTEAAVETGLCRGDEVAKLSQGDQRRLGAALRNRGCVKRQEMVDGKRCTIWRAE